MNWDEYWQRFTGETGVEIDPSVFARSRVDFHLVWVPEELDMRGQGRDMVVVSVDGRGVLVLREKGLQSLVQNLTVMAARMRRRSSDRRDQDLQALLFDVDLEEEDNV